MYFETICNLQFVHDLFEDVPVFYYLLLRWEHVWASNPLNLVQRLLLANLQSSLEPKWSPPQTLCITNWEESWYIWWLWFSDWLRLNKSMCNSQHLVGALWCYCIGDQLGGVTFRMSFESWNQVLLIDLLLLVLREWWLEEGLIGMVTCISLTYILNWRCC